MMNTMTKKLPTHELAQAGQSPWIDSLSREMLRSGRLKQMIASQGVLGLTSNPSIFQTAITEGQGVYAGDIKRLVRKGASAIEIYDQLSIADIQSACDLLKSVWSKTKGEHGYVSLEVLPTLAYKTAKTIQEAERLWKKVARPNLMIKVPATPQGIPAIQELISKGISVNVTLIFSESQYNAVAQAYLAGLQMRAKKKQDLSHVRSVASVFVSRFDTWIDKQLELLAQDSKGQKKESLLALRGKAGIANSKLIYQQYKKLFSTASFQQLEKNGAHAQRVLWGSTSCKNPNYSDLLYVENLVGKNTVNTMPQVTLDALIDHGRIQPDTIESDLSGAKKCAEELKKFNLDLVKIGEMLQIQGVKLFCDAFDHLVQTLELAILSTNKKTSKLPSFKVSIPQSDRSKVEQEINAFKSAGGLERLLCQDASLWKTEPEHQKVILNRLGWLKVHEWMLGKLYDIESFQEEVKSAGIKSVILLGMGGSSLAPEVMNFICQKSSGTPKLFILDTTDPASIRDVEKQIALKKALFVVASKSGSTIETLSQFSYFYDRVKSSYGTKATTAGIGSHFMAITDPGSSLEKLAASKCFRKCYLNPSNIGGRYSALSLFGIVPAALVGIPVRSLLEAARASYNFGANPQIPIEKKEGFYLGAVIGALGKLGRDKLTLVTSTSLNSFGSWLEQLIAESTGKEKVGVLPVDTEELADASVYGEDRLFLAFLSKKDAAESQQIRTRLGQLKRAGFPVIEVDWESWASLGAEFLNWEIATSVASSLLKINPFDEPNVTESKNITQELLGVFKKNRAIENPTRYFYANKTVEWGLILKQIRKGSYVALLAYVPRSEKMLRAFQRLRNILRRHFRVPVLLGFGPRYLHSIGQFYKGGTASGLFIEFLIHDRQDLAIPDQPYGFSLLKRAQALGDFEAIQNKTLPIIAVDLGTDAVAGISSVEKQIIKQLEK